MCGKTCGQIVAAAPCGYKMWYTGQKQKKISPAGRKIRLTGPPLIVYNEPCVLSKGGVLVPFSGGKTPVSLTDTTQTAAP